MTLKEQFEKAFSDSKLIPEKPDNETLLKLYSLFKQATEGNINIEPPTNMFDFVNKAKHDAWSLQKGKSTEQAMEEYISLVHKLNG